MEKPWYTVPNLNDIIAGVALQTSMGVQLSPDIVVLHVIMAKVVHHFSLSLTHWLTEMFFFWNRTTFSLSLIPLPIS